LANIEIPTGNKPKVLIIVGPTGSGKSLIGFAIAKKLGAEIVSADSRQIFKYLDIGTAKPSRDELSEVKHHFIDEKYPNEVYNAGEYSKDARIRIENIFKQNKIPIIVGGSGLYIHALVDGFFDGPSADGQIRSELEYRMKTEGSKKLLEELRTIDPISASKMLPSNSRRIVRALEVFRITGEPISKLQKNIILPDFDPVFVGPNWDRKKLYQRINARVDWMIGAGLLSEVNKLIEKGYSSSMNALQTVGYQEVFEFLNGKISFDEMTDLIKKNSRHYAKRQLTWFRRDARIKWFDVRNEKELIAISDNIYKYFSIN
jgi:tRNA dimethylallyltransferase